MDLSLNNTQRLNLVHILGLKDIQGRELHAIWHLQDLLDLSEEEKQNIEFRQEIVNGSPVQLWNPEKEKDTQPRTFDVSESDIERIRKTIEEFPQFRGSRDRIWLEPLLAQLPPLATRNGSGG